ncbi:hypothetical protein B7494_g3349 [Chlorociboria aeruginascens]|nr:hypothetical protein B7494_g3349 [Chlorociboria aeruginascens]
MEPNPIALLIQFGSPAVTYFISLMLELRHTLRTPEVINVLLIDCCGGVEDGMDADHKEVQEKLCVHPTTCELATSYNDVLASCLTSRWRNIRSSSLVNDMTTRMQSLIWSSTIPLHITHPSSPIPYLLLAPRLSYLPLLLPQLNLFYSIAHPEPIPPSTSFTYETIFLKNLPIGLLYDLYQPSLPWEITLSNGPMYDIHDTYINSVKEADFIRFGTARGVMSLSREDSKGLWGSVRDNDYATFLRITTPLLNPSTPLKHIPLRIYIPSSIPTPGDKTPQAEFKIIQTLLPPYTNKREPQTLGTALNTILPTLFPTLWWLVSQCFLEGETKKTLLVEDHQTKTHQPVVEHQQLPVVDKQILALQCEQLEADEPIEADPQLEEYEEANAVVELFESSFNFRRCLYSNSNR